MGSRARDPAPLTREGLASPGEQTRETNPGTKAAALPKTARRLDNSDVSSAVMEIVERGHPSWCPRNPLGTISCNFAREERGGRRVKDWMGLAMGRNADDCVRPLEKSSRAIAQHAACPNILLGSKKSLDFDHSAYIRQIWTSKSQFLKGPFGGLSASYRRSSQLKVSGTNFHLIDYPKRSEVVKLRRQNQQRSSVPPTSIS